jgi:hypothetical protein
MPGVRHLLTDGLRWKMATIPVGVLENILIFARESRHFCAAEGATRSRSAGS